MIKMKVLGTKATMQQVQREFDKRRRADFQLKSATMLKALKEATPVDTGFARDQWTIVYAGDSAKLFNPVPYIEKLNEGHSKQAPALFVETTALKFGRPEGSIVSKIPSA